jgi:pentatricopeptide repeat protein
MLQSGKVETRDFLRPIFKWLKYGNKHYNPEKAFQYVEWMITIRDAGDHSLEIKRQPHIQPKYAYNTIVTMCQRNGDHNNAMRAYDCMIQFSFQPDVFTMTALLDVIGRNGRFTEAIGLYQTMIEQGDNLPNVVTFVTLIRVASNLTDKTLAKRHVRELLEDAHRLVTSASAAQVAGKDGNVVISIFNASLSACVRMNDFEFFGKILADMAARGVEWTTLTHDIVSKFYYRRRDTFPSLSEYLTLLEQCGAYDLERRESLNEYIQKYVFEKDTNTSEKKFYAGCLGPDAPEALRISVMVHDLNKLLERLDPEDTSQLTESDFVTLLHQCRKRRWSDQIEYIISQMDLVSTEGVPASGIAPVLHLAPSRITYEAALDGYFHSGHSSEAWALLTRMLEVEVDVDEDFLYSTVWGFMRCGDASLGTQAFLAILEKDVRPTVEVVVCLFRGLGRNVDLALSIFSALFETDFSQELATNSTLERLILTLLESCAVLGAPDGIDQFVKLIEHFSHPVLLSCFTNLTQSGNSALSIVCVLAACNHTDIAAGFQCLSRWQGIRLIPPLTVVFTLALEFYASCLDGSSQIPKPPDLKSLPFRGFLRFGTLKYADLKANYMHKLFADLSELKRIHPSVSRACSLTGLLDSVESSEVDFLRCLAGGTLSGDILLRHYISAYQLHHCSCSSCSVLVHLFLQFLLTKTLFIRSKQDKLSLVTSLTNSLNPLSEDSFRSFFSDAVHSLSLLSISSKQQAKLISLLLLSLSSSRRAVVEQLVEDLFSERKEIRPCIDVLKELYKQFPIASALTKERVTGLLLSYLQDGVESPIRIVQMLKPFDLFSPADRHDSSSFDVAIAERYLQDPSSHWMALTTYIGDHEDRSDACRRVCRLLLQRDSPDSVLKVLTKFQHFNDSEFLHLLHPSKELFNPAASLCIASAAETATASTFSDLPVLQLSHFSQRLVLVDNLEALREAQVVFEELMRAGGEAAAVRAAEGNGGRSEELLPVVALDSEWRPFNSPLSAGRNNCSLLQLATASHIFLFDLMVLEPGWPSSASELQELYSATVGSLFAHEAVLKIGTSLPGFSCHLIVNLSLSRCAVLLCCQDSGWRETSRDSARATLLRLTTTACPGLGRLVSAEGQGQQQGMVGQEDWMRCAEKHWDCGWTSGCRGLIGR